MAQARNGRTWIVRMPLYYCLSKKQRGGERHFTIINKYRSITKSGSSIKGMMMPKSTIWHFKTERIHQQVQQHQIVWNTRGGKLSGWLKNLFLGNENWLHNIQPSQGASLSKFKVKRCLHKCKHRVFTKRFQVHTETLWVSFPQQYIETFTDTGWLDSYL